MQIGYTGHYMRFRYTYSDHSLDFNIMDYKGSVQFKGKFMKFMFFASENVPWVIIFHDQELIEIPLKRLKFYFEKVRAGPVRLILKELAEN